MERNGERSANGRQSGFDRNQPAMLYIIGDNLARQATDPIAVEQSAADGFGGAEFECDIDRTKLPAEVPFQDFPCT